MSRSRSAIGAVVVGLILFVVYYWLFIKTNFKRILLILFLVTIIPVIFFKTGEDKIDKFFIKSQPSISFTPHNLPSTTSNLVTESFDIRKIVWQGAWELALKYPLFGTGVETFAFSYNFVRPVSHNLTSEWDYVYNKAHNEYFNYLATTGFVGLGSYLLLIFSFQFLIFNRLLKFKFRNTKNSIKNKKFGMKIEENQFNEQILTLLLSIAFITILITNFFGFSTTTIQLFFFLIPGLVILGRSKIMNLESKYDKINFYQWLLIVVITVSTIYLLFSITVYYLADINYSYGTKYAKVVDHQKAASYFETALKLRQEPVYEDRFSASLAYLSVAAVLQNQKDLAKQITALSDSYNRKTIKAYPKNVFYWKTRAKNMYYFYQITGNNNELLQGIEALKTSKYLYPTDPKIPYTLALYYSILYDSAKNNTEKQNWQKFSLDEINKTIELKSNYREAYLFKGQLLKKYGKIDEAKKVFEYMLKNFDKNDADVLKELKDL
jgi:hypothetical protein